MVPMPMATSLRMGLAFWGIVEDAPRPWVSGSRTSPISVRARSATSRAMRTQVLLMAAARKHASAMPSRATCQGTSTGVRPRLAATA